MTVKKYAVIEDDLELPSYLKIIKDSGFEGFIVVKLSDVLAKLEEFERNFWNIPPNGEYVNIVLKDWKKLKSEIGGDGK